MRRAPALSTVLVFHALVVSTAWAAAAQPTPIDGETPEVRRRAESVLREALEHGDVSHRLRAAGYLLALGYEIPDAVSTDLEGRDRDRDPGAPAPRAVEAEGALAELLNSSKPDHRAHAARALLSLARIDRPTWETLNDAARLEPAHSPARVALVAAALKHAPPDNADAIAALRKEIRRHAATGSSDDRREACGALAQSGVQEDMPLLTVLLDAEDADEQVRITAAYALCRVARRRPAGLSAFDWLIIALYGLGMIGVGWFYTRRTRTTEDYLLGGRTMRPWAVGLSMFATLLSTISYLSYPGEVVRYGPMLLGGIVAYPLIYVVETKRGQS